MTITGASTVFTLTIGPPAQYPSFGASLFSAPQQLQGFAADDIFNTESFVATESVMGLDGTKVTGIVLTLIKQTIALQADSPSSPIFDIWWNASQTGRIAYYAQGVVSMPTIGTKWTMLNGLLTNYQPLPTNKKLLQPRRFEITWQSVGVAASLPASPFSTGQFTPTPIVIPFTPPRSPDSLIIPELVSDVGVPLTSETGGILLGGQ